jgi:hypothetical protein
LLRFYRGWKPLPQRTYFLADKVALSAMTRYSEEAPQAANPPGAPCSKWKAASKFRRKSEPSPETRSSYQSNASPISVSASGRTISSRVTSGSQFGLEQHPRVILGWDLADRHPIAYLIPRVALRTIVPSLVLVQCYPKCLPQVGCVQTRSISKCQFLPTCSSFPLFSTIQ